MLDFDELAVKYNNRIVNVHKNVKICLYSIYTFNYIVPLWKREYYEKEDVLI